MQLKQFLMYGIEEFKRDGSGKEGSALPIAVDPPAYTRNKIKEVELEYQRKQEEKLKQKKERQTLNADKENQNDNDVSSKMKPLNKEELLKAYEPLYLAQRKQSGKARKEADE